MDKIPFSKSWSKTAYDDSKKKPSLYPSKELPFISFQKLVLLKLGIS